MMASVSLLVLVLQLSSALCSLPAPINLKVKSVNFHHVLHWDPGPSSPPGTRYMISQWIPGRKMKLLPNSTSETSLKLKLEPRKEYNLVVRAIHNQTRSSLSSRITFAPFRDTTIGPPVLALAGCGTCVQGNISLPDADGDSGVPDMFGFYKPQFSVLWRKEKDEKIEELDTDNKSFTLRNLEDGVKFCFQVHLKIRTNKNTQPSEWTCTFSSPEETEQDLFVPAVVSALLGLLVIVVLVVGTCRCLYYTGFICKLKKVMPRALTMDLWKNYILTPDRTVSDQVFISPDTRNQRKLKHPPVPPSSTGDSEEEDDEEEDNRINLYMDREAELSSGQSSQQSSGNLKDSGSSVENPAAETTEELQAEPDLCDSNTERVCLVQEGGRTGVQEPSTAQEEEVQDISGDVNLFSVTLSMAPCDEGEMDTNSSFTELLKESRLNLWTDPTPERDLQVFGEDFSGPSRRPADTWIQPEEEEEEEEEEEQQEEEFFGYMSHR